MQTEKTFVNPHRLTDRQRGKLKHCANELRVDDRTYRTAPGILGGFPEHFRSLATPADATSLNKNYGELVECEVREIMDLCCGSLVEEQPIARRCRKSYFQAQQGKAADFYGVTAEHFLHGGEELLSKTNKYNQLSIYIWKINRFTQNKCPDFRV